MKDLVTPVPTEEINAVVKSCLEKAALINYTKMSEIAKIEGWLAMSDIFVAVATGTTTITATAAAIGGACDCTQLSTRDILRSVMSLLHSSIIIITIIIRAS